MRRSVRTLVCLLACLLFCFPALAQTRVACVGDSITFGFHNNISYPAYLQALLGSGYVVGNFGQNGTTVLHNGNNPYTHSAAYNASIAFAPDIVVIMLGTNDTKPQNWQHCADFVPDYCALIAAYQQLPSAPAVYVMTPPPAYPNNFGIDGDVLANQELPLYPQIYSQVITLDVDMFGFLLPFANDFPDGVHPTDFGAYLIAQRVYNALTSLPALPTPSALLFPLDPPHHH